MKKITILFAFALVLGLSFASCNKDDDSSSSSSSASLEGKWNFSKEDTTVDDTEILVDYNGNESGCSKDYIMINANGTISSVDYDSFNSPCEVFTDNGTWVRSGNSLSVTLGGETFTSEILTLTSSELKVRDFDGEITVFTRG
ncbi:hypothetical protein FCR2A7T_05940 [Flavobacterium cauense R2A-7]|uniref:Lipocalin-like protein n=1 Tax=Flavobacterium cauense R2A-7 TaxID=1341154 RepID=V6S4W0_9FLAO|nr:lipocalin family protein [Flavobacterium cauense]ESU21297.1 hypothetical protein FCR2A7T_05940 [Flavobacterium cauense R2A-7]KGO80054.1 hypothetical protein Q762_13245 [Flavobacterium cauense R2A-7]TWI08993.1 lipocalin-like protein [Flavobacterium cauense R2A-7]